MTSAEAKALTTVDTQTDDWQIDATMDMIYQAARWGDTSISMNRAMRPTVVTRLRGMGFVVNVVLLVTTVSWSAG